MSVVRAVLKFLYEVFLGCNHEHLTRPFTLQNETYMVCLDCGRRIYYSTETMRTLTAREARRIHAANAGEVRVMPSPAGAPRLLPVRARKTGTA